MLRPAQAPPASRRPAHAGPGRPPRPHLPPSRPPAPPRRQRPRAPPRAAADDVTGAPGHGTEQGARLRSAAPSSRQLCAGGAASCLCRSARGGSCCRAECADPLRVLDARRNAAAEVSAHPQPRSLTCIRCSFPERLRAQPFHRPCGQPVPVHHHFGE